MSDHMRRGFFVFLSSPAIHLEDQRGNRGFAIPNRTLALSKAGGISMGILSPSLSAQLIVIHSLDRTLQEMVHGFHHDLMIKIGFRVNGSTRNEFSNRLLLFGCEAVATTETLYTPGGVNNTTLLSGVKRVALGANVYSHSRLCGNRFVRCATCTRNHTIHVLRMDSWFHDMSSSSETLECKNQ